MRPDPVPPGILVIVVVKTLAPVGRILTEKERHKAPPLHIEGLVQAGDINKCLCDIQKRNDLVAFGVGFDDSGPARDEGSFQRFLQDPALVEPAVFPEKEPLIAGEDDEGVVGQPLVVEILEQLPDALVHGQDAAEIIVHVTLVFPSHEILA